MNLKHVLAGDNKQLNEQVTTTKDVVKLLEHLIANGSNEELYHVSEMLRKARSKHNCSVLNLTSKSGPLPDILKDEKVAFAISVEGSIRHKTIETNKKFKSNHTHGTIYAWLREHYKDKL